MQDRKSKHALKLRKKIRKATSSKHKAFSKLKIKINSEDKLKNPRFLFRREFLPIRLN